MTGMVEVALSSYSAAIDGVLETSHAEGECCPERTTRLTGLSTERECVEEGLICSLTVSCGCGHAKCCVLREADQKGRGRESFLPALAKCREGARAGVSGLAGEAVVSHVGGSPLSVATALTKEVGLTGTGTGNEGRWGKGRGG
jgi:hypothetical protein